MLGRQTLFLSPMCLQKHTHRIMIRLFTVFCKLNFKTLSVKDLFLQAMEEFSPDKLPSVKLPCPFCGAKHPDWAYHDSYPRYLISYENGAPVTYTIDITRVICSSCQHTHAILPEMIIPHSSYSLIFVLSVLKDYFSRLPVKTLCEKYQIGLSTLYAWKQLFLQHKKLWLGILEDLCTDPLAFLSSLPPVHTSRDLWLFFLNQGYSFLQGVTKTAHCNSS